MCGTFLNDLFVFFPLVNEGGLNDGADWIFSSDYSTAAGAMLIPSLFLTVFHFISLSFHTISYHTLFLPLSYCFLPSFLSVILSFHSFLPRFSSASPPFLFSHILTSFLPPTLCSFFLSPYIHPFVSLFYSFASLSFCVLSFHCSVIFSFIPPVRPPPLI